eukprot:4333488-Pleurochrysis_carterae.AAC.4
MVGTDMGWGKTVSNQPAQNRPNPAARSRERAPAVSSDSSQDQSKQNMTAAICLKEVRRCLTLAIATVTQPLLLLVIHTCSGHVSI